MDLMFIREKKIICKNYIEIDIIPRPHTERNTGKRSKKTRVSRPQQKNLNDKNARRYLLQIAQGNFTKEDIHLSLTYKPKFLPETVEEAEKEAEKFFRRIRYHRKKLGLEPLKYISVIERGKQGAIHHHIIINGGLDRDKLEDLWSRGRGKNKETLGWVNADRIQTDGRGLEALARYITKDPQGKKRWTSSQNLARPESINNDWKYSRKKMREAGFSNDGGEAFIKKNYPNINIADIDVKYYEETGWHIYARGFKT